MATLKAVLTPDYANSITVTNATASLAGVGSGLSTTAAPLTFGKRRILHIVALNTGTTANRCVLNYTLGLSTGTTAPTPVIGSPFFLGDEGWTIDLGDCYDQIQLGNAFANNGNTAVAYSITVMCKY